MNYNTFLKSLEENGAEAAIESLNRATDGQILLPNGNNYNLKGAIDLISEGKGTYEGLARKITNTAPPTKDVPAVEALGSGINTGLSGMWDATGGQIIETVNEGVRQVEKGARRGINALTGSDLSLENEDMLFSSDNPIGGKGDLRDTIEGSGIVVHDYEDLDKDNKELFKAGEAFSGVALAPVTGGVGVGVWSAGKFKLGTELAAATGGAVGAAIAENIDPDNPWVAMGQELLFGNLATSSKEILLNGVPNTAKFAFQKASNLTSSLRMILGDNSKFADIAYADIIREAEADGIPLKTFIEQVNENAGDFLTAGRATRSDNLIALEKALSRGVGGKGFEGDRAKQLAKTLEVRRALAMKILGTEGAAVNYTNNVLALHQLNLQSQLSDLVDDFGKSAEIAAAGKRATGILEASHQRLREYEEALWSEIPLDAHVRFNSLTEVLSDVNIDDELNGTGLNGILGRFKGLAQNAGADEIGDALGAGEIGPEFAADALGATGVDATSGAMLDVVSKLSRFIADTDNKNAARIAGDVRNAILNDIGDSVDGNAVTLARTFTKAKYDLVGNGSFVQNELRQASYNRAAADPSQLFYRAAGNGRNDFDLNTGNMEATAQAADNPASLVPDIDDQMASALAKDTTYAPDLNESLDEGLRAIVGNAINRETMEIPQSVIKQYLQDNPDIKNRFKNFERDFRNIIKAEKAVVDFSKRFGGDVSSFTDTFATTRNALKSTTPEASFRELFDIGMKSADPAQFEVGLRLGILEDAFEAATKDGVIDFTKLKKVMTDKLPNSNSSRLDLMTQNELITDEAKGLFEDLLDSTARIQNLDKTSKSARDNVTKSAGEIAHNTSRIAGANLYSILGMGGGASIQAANIGANAVQRYIFKKPAQTFENHLRAALLQPELIVEWTKNNDHTKVMSFLDAASNFVGTKLPIKERLRNVGAALEDSMLRGSHTKAANVFNETFPEEESEGYDMRLRITVDEANGPTLDEQTEEVFR